jgi:predicted ATP-binding protein involved in virulence
MKLTRLVVTQLFDQFDYDIPLSQPEGLLILTAPNGFGKTMILNIIDSLFNSKLDFFKKLVFEKIVFFIDDLEKIRIAKNERLEFFLDGKVVFVSGLQLDAALLAREIEKEKINWLKPIGENQ